MGISLLNGDLLIHDRRRSAFHFDKCSPTLALTISDSISAEVPPSKTHEFSKLQPLFSRSHTLSIALREECLRVEVRRGSEQ